VWRPACHCPQRQAGGGGGWLFPCPGAPPPLPPPPLVSRTQSTLCHPSVSNALPTMPCRSSSPALLSGTARFLYHSGKGGWRQIGALWRVDGSRLTIAAVRDTLSHMHKFTRMCTHITQQAERITEQALARLKEIEGTIGAVRVSFSLCLFSPAGISHTKRIPLLLLLPFIRKQYLPLNTETFFFSPPADTLSLLTCTCARACTHAKHTLSTQARTYAPWLVAGEGRGGCIYTCICKQTYIYIHKYTYGYICIFTYTHGHIYTYVHTCIYIHVYMYKRIYIYIYVNM